MTRYIKSMNKYDYAIVIIFNDKYSTIIHILMEIRQLLNGIIHGMKKNILLHQLMVLLLNRI